MMIKKMFGENKDKPIITALDKEEIERNIYDFLRARHEIERLCIDEIRFTFFQVRTKLAKEALVQKATEVLTLITTKTAEIVTDNIARITKSYQDMCDKMLSQPKNELELVELKNFIADTDINLLKISNEVDCVELYLDLFERVSHPYSDKHIENFYELRTWPQEIKIALIEGQRNTNAQEQKFTEKLENEKEIFAQELLEL